MSVHQNDTHARATKNVIDQLPSDELLGELEPVAYFNDAMPTGVTVSHQGRIFVNFPKWGDEVAFSVAEICNDKTVAYPNEAINQSNTTDDPSAALVSVQSVVVDPLDRLWILDTGSPLFKRTEYGGPKVLCVDLTTNKVVKKILFPQDVALPTTYLNDLRFDLRRNKEGVIFITDSSQNGPNGIIVLDIASGESWRRLNDHYSTKAEDIQTFLPIVEGRPFLEHLSDGSVKQGASMGADGIAISANGDRLYYCPLGSRKLFRVETNVLVDWSFEDQKVAARAAGYIYSTNYEHNAILRRGPDMKWETVVHDPRLLWPDTLSLAADGYLYVTANQLHRQARYNKGNDLRRKPYTLFRIRVDTQPVLLR